MREFPKICIIFLLIIFLFQANYAFALEIKYPSLPGTLTPEEINQKLKVGEINSGEVLALYFKYFFNLSFIIVVTICVGVLIYGGVLYLLSPARPAILVSAKKWISSALLGLLILVCSYAVLYTINPQLTIFRLERELREISEKPKAEIPSLFKRYAYIPTGKLIEEKLDKLEETTTTQRGERLVLVNKIEQVADEIVQKSKRLRRQLNELKSLTDNCRCGISQCEPGSRYEWSRGRCWCKPKETPCTIDCDKELIIAQMEAVGKTISELKAIQMKIVTLQTPLIIDDLELRAAGMLMSLSQDLADYSFFAYQRLLQEKREIEVEPEVALAGWPELNLFLESKLAKVEQWTQDAKNVTSTNQVPCNEILSNIGLIKQNIENISERINEIEGETEETFRQGTLEKINEAITTIENHLPIIKEPLISSIVNTYLPQITSQAQILQLVDYTKEKIIKETKTPGEIQSIVEKLRERLFKEDPNDEIESIKELTEKAKNAPDSQAKLLALSKIKLRIPIIRGYLYKIWKEQGEIVADPATFFYDPEIWENEKIKKETERLNPIIVFAETSPAEVNTMIAQALNEVLGPETFELSKDEWDEIANQAITEAMGRGVEDIFETLGETLAEELRKRILENFQEQIESSLFLAFIPKIPVAQAQGEYQEKVVRDYLAKQLDNVLKTELPPFIENALKKAAADLIADWTAKNAPALLTPETYEGFHQKFSEFYTTKLQDLVPQLSEILSTQLIDYVPDFLADYLNLINDNLKSLVEDFKNYVTSQITQLVDSIVIKLGKSLGVGDTFLEVFVSAINIFLEDYTGVYIEANLFQRLDVYRWQRQIEGWLSLTVKDVLPKKIQEDLETPLIEYLKEEAPDIANFLQDADGMTKKARDALVEKKGVIKKKIEEIAKKPVKNVLFEKVEDILEKTVYEILLLSPEIKKVLQYSIRDQLPSKLTQPLYNAFPEKAKAKLVDLLLPEYAKILKTKRLIDLIEDPEKKYCLTTPWEQIRKTGKAQKCLGFLGESLIEMMGKEAKVLNKPIIEMMDEENKGFFNKTPLETFPKEFRQTGFQVLGIDNPNTSRNEAKAGKILDYCSEPTKILVQLIYQYLPDPNDRPEGVNKLLTILNKSPYNFIAEPLPPAGLGLGQPETAKDLDKPLPDLLPTDETAKDYLTKKTWAEILKEIGIDLNQTLLDRLASGDPKLHRALTAKLGEIIDKDDLENNPDKTMLELIGQKLGDSSIAEKIQDKKLIELTGISFLSKSILELIQERQGSNAHNIFSKSFYYFLPQEIKDRFETDIGNGIKNQPPFNQKIIELLPQKWQETIADYFGIDIDEAVEKAIQETNIEEEINKAFGRNKERISNEIAKSLLRVYAKTTGEKLAQDPEKLEQLREGISDVLTPLAKKAIEEKLQKGYLLNSLKELK